MIKTDYFNIELPYHTQLNNDSDWNSGPWNECSYTCMAMFLRSMGYVGNGDGQFEDQLERACESFMLTRGEPLQMSKFMTENFPSDLFDYEFRYDCTWAMLQEKLYQGIPAILHTWLTASGHVVLLKGWDNKAYGGAGAYIFHDPYGEWFPSGYVTNVSGANVRYSKSLCNRLIGTDGDLWAHFGTKK